MDSPKPPKPTGQQLAFEKEQRAELNRQTIEENRRRKALSRGQLGSVTLLSGLPSSDSVAVSPTGAASALDGGQPSTGVNQGSATGVSSAKPKKPKARKLS